MMPILTLQRRSRELGRIRIGQQVRTESGKTRPTKLESFRLTSASSVLLEKVAALYGGTVTEWNNGGTEQYEVITTATRLPVLVPPQPVSQFFELWSGGGCQRRCDGERELLTDKPCLCEPDPEDRQCKPTTRLNVVLRDVEGVGVWRLESHGYYAATELPSTAEFLAQASGYIAGWLSLEQRTVVRNGKTKRFAVPTIEVDITPAALMAAGAPAALTASSAAGALPAAPAAEPPITVDDVAATASLEELRALYERGRQIGQGMDQGLNAAFSRRAAELEQDRAAEEPAAEEPPTPMVTKPQLAKIHAALGNCKVTEPERHTTLGMLIQRPITSANELTLAEARHIIDVLDACAKADEPDVALDVALSNLDTITEVTS